MRFWPPVLLQSLPGPGPSGVVFKWPAPILSSPSPLWGVGKQQPSTPIAAGLPLCPALHNWLLVRSTGSDLAHPGLCLCSTLISQAPWSIILHFSLKTGIIIPTLQFVGKFGLNSYGKYLACGICPVGASCSPLLGPSGLWGSKLGYISDFSAVCIQNDWMTRNRNPLKNVLSQGIFCKQIVSGKAITASFPSLLVAQLLAFGSPVCLCRDDQRLSD